MAQAVRAQEARRRTLTVYTDVRRVTDALAIDDTDTVTVLLVDADGRVRWRTTGPVTEHSGAGLLATLTRDGSHNGACGRTVVDRAVRVRVRSAVPSVSRADSVSRPVPRT